MVSQLEDSYFNFDNYNILIFGGNSGFGLEILKTFSKYNNKIIIVGRNQKKINNALNEVKKINQNNKILSFKANLINEKTVKSLFNKIKSKKINKIDIVINCIGINKRNNIENLNFQDWKEVININLNIPFLISKFFNTVAPFVELLLQFCKISQRSKDFAAHQNYFINIHSVLCFPFDDSVLSPYFY